MNQEAFVLAFHPVHPSSFILHPFFSPKGNPMSLSAAPTITMGSAGNITPSQLASRAGTSTTQGPFYIGVSGQSGSQGSATTGSALGGRVQVWNTGGATVAGTNGLQVTIYSTSDGTNYDTLPFGGTGFIIPTTASTAVLQSFDLPPGQYKIVLKNLDTANAITVEATLATVA